jgi:phage terminase small subunit
MELNEKQRSLFDSMTKLQQKFSLGIVKGLSQIDAYRQAGGKAKTNDTARACASEILTKPNVKAFIDEIGSAAITDAVMTRQEALERLSVMARASIHEMVEFGESDCGLDEDGKPIIQASWRFKPSTLQSPESLAAISELTAGPRGISLKLHDPKAAIKQLAEMQGWEPPKESKLTITTTKPLSALFDDDET